MPGDYAQATFDMVVLKRRVMRIFRSPEAQTIDFYLGVLHVTGAGFLRVADAVSRDKIGIRVGSVSPKAAASFKPWVFDFPNGQFGIVSFQEASIVHEAVHAMKALTLPFTGLMPDTQEEAAAYVAEALYLRYDGFPSSASNPQLVKADLIAQAIMGRPGALVSKRDEDNLRVWITTRPVYYESGVTYSSTTYR